MAYEHRLPDRRRRPGSRTTLAAFVLAGFVLAVLATAASPQDAARALADLSRFIELKAELMARLEAGDPAAVALAQQVLDRANQLFGSNHPEIVKATLHLAYAEQRAGDYEGARSHHAAALTQAEKLLGPDHPITGVVLMHSGTHLATLGEHAAARGQLERSLSIMKRHFDPGSVEVAVSLNSLGNLLHDLGEFAEARRMLTRVVEITEEKLGPDHPRRPLLWATWRWSCWPMAS